MARFADGAVEDMSDVFQCYLYPPDESGVTLFFGGLFTDSPPVDGKYYSKREFDDPSDLENGEVLPFIFDGHADGVLRGEFCASSGSLDSSGGGCASGFFAAAALLTAAITVKRRKKRVFSNKPTNSRSIGCF
ncbi:MAG: SYNERG-CTERM sorting domain-containing protein [Synergistaceae bacterium]|jgi:Synergist-CTERM protein sorting domain-containing protein|nr:SYNERG-CTERM sorting domain-containing protein [Synergistaceae bacterium]